MENVSGMVKGKMKLIFAEIIKELKRCGYKVWVKFFNAMYFGVPQSRQRLIFIGVRSDLGIKPSHPKAENVPISSRNAIDKLNISKIETYNSTPDYIKKYLLLMKNGEQASKYHPKGHYFNSSRINKNKPSQTITKTPNLYHYNENRLLAREELKYLSSYPLEFRFIGGLSNIYNRIGNSVPPLFMRSIAKHIIENILNIIN